MDTYIWVLGLLGLIGIEIAPIKFNPITLLGNGLSRWLGIGELKKSIRQVDNKIEEVKKEVDTNELDRIRYEILQFSQSLRNGTVKSHNDYTHIEELYEKYTTKGGNSYISSEMTFIRHCHNQLPKIEEPE